MKVSYNADAELLAPVRRKGPKSEEILAIKEFLESDNNSIVFEYEDEDTARRKRNNISVCARKNQILIKVLLRGKKVIVLRKMKTND